MMKAPRLFVIWQTPPPSRERHVVGELWKQKEGFAFAYRSDLELARRAGFTNIPEFPELRTADSPYTSGYLFGTFAQRIPSPQRGDRAAMLAGWAVLDPDDALEILARSGGLLATDRLELAEYRDDTDDLTTPLDVRLAGGRFQGAIRDVRPNDVLTLEREPANEHDCNATVIRSRAGEKLGYVPRQYSSLVARRLDAGHEITATAAIALPSPPDESRWVIRLG